MATTPKTNHRSLVSLHLPQSVPALITYARGIVQAMTGNASFPVPVPTLAAVTTAIDELDAAEREALTRAKGAIVTRNEKRTALIVLLQQLKAYVQAMADANVENGASIIESAGVAVKRVPVHKPRTFVAKPGAISGSAKLFAATSARRAAYEWEYSSDGAHTWVTTPTTLQAKTTVSGLSPGATVLFRYRSVTKAGEADWSQPVSLLVR